MCFTSTTDMTDSVGDQGMVTAMSKAFDIPCSILMKELRKHRLEERAVRRVENKTIPLGW